MHTSFNPVNVFDASPFQYARMTYLSGRVDENLAKVEALRNLSTGRMASNHLLMRILASLTTPFKGDLFTYIDAVEQDCERICSGQGITTSYSRGRLHNEGHFYNGCQEIITCVRSERWNWMDLWNNWRAVSAIEVLEHPVTDLTLFEPAVMNEAKLSTPGLAVVNIDIPLMACQWRMWRAANPFDSNELFITQVLLPGMLKSHLDLVIYNKVLQAFGLREACTVNTNFLFSQTPTNTHADDLVKEIYAKITSKRLSANQILTSIPCLYSPNALVAGAFPSTPPTHQILWAIITQKESRASLVLAQGALMGYDRLLQDLVRIRRTAIQVREDQVLSTGHSTQNAEWLNNRFKALVMNKLPPI